MKLSLVSVCILVLGLFASSCATAPKLSQNQFSNLESLRWLNDYCAYSIQKNGRTIEGSVLIRAQTPEFKGQHPASIQVGPDGHFLLEVTHILGGTLAQISGNSNEMSLNFPGNEKYNREGVKDYLGVPAKVITQLFSGYLPCPEIKSDLSSHQVVSEPGGVLIRMPEGDWYFQRAIQQDGAVSREVPESLKIYSGKRVTKEQKPWIDLTISDWDSEKKVIQKALLKSSLADQKTRELKWSWRSRSEK